jgi:hypothetical protein
MNYGVGVRAAPGYCSIEWRQLLDDIFSFTVSGDTGVTSPGKYSAQSFDSHGQPSLYHPRINLLLCSKALYLDVVPLL